MPVMRSAICNEAFAEWPLEKAYDFAAQCGCTGIEVAPLHARAAVAGGDRRAHHRRLARTLPRQRREPPRAGGFGAVDFVPIFRALDEIRYAGWVSVEVFDYDPRPERLACDSIDSMQRVAAEAG